MKGFTLVEVLVAIVIMVILGAVTLSMFNSAWRSSRDQQRLRDLNSLKQTLEIYRADKGFYPDAADFSSELTPKYLETMPADPISGRHYSYQTTPTTFILCAKKEGSSSLGDSVDCSGLICTDDNQQCDTGVSFN